MKTWIKLVLQAIGLGTVALIEKHVDKPKKDEPAEQKKAKLKKKSEVTDDSN